MKERTPAFDPIDENDSPSKKIVTHAILSVVRGDKKKRKSNAKKQSTGGITDPIN